MRALLFGVAACSAPASAPAAPPSLANAKAVAPSHDVRLHVRGCGPGGIRACYAALLQTDIRWLQDPFPEASADACGAHIEVLDEDWDAGHECQLSIRRGGQTWLVDAAVLCLVYHRSGVPKQRFDVMMPSCNGDELAIALDLHGPAEHRTIRCRPDARGLACSRDRGTIGDPEIAGLLGKLVAALVAHRWDELRAMCVPDTTGKPLAAYLALVFGMPGEDLSKISALDIEDVGDDGDRIHVLGTAHTTEGRVLRFSSTIVHEGSALLLEHRRR